MSGICMSRSDECEGSLVAGACSMRSASAPLAASSARQPQRAELLAQDERDSSRCRRRRGRAVRRSDAGGDAAFAGADCFSSLTSNQNVLPLPSSLSHADRPAHQLDELAADREAESGAAVAARRAAVGLGEAVEDRRLALGRRCRCRCRARRGGPVRASASRSRTLASITTSPRSVNLTALPTRLVSTWRRRPGSPTHVLREVGRRRCRRARALSAARCGASSSATSSTNVAQIEVERSRSSACRPRSSRSRGCR